VGTRHLIAVRVRRNATFAVAFFLRVPGSGAAHHAGKGLSCFNGRRAGMRVRRRFCGVLKPVIVKDRRQRCKVSSFRAAPAGGKHPTDKKSEEKSCGFI
jgi:hypothetical protein